MSFELRQLRHFESLYRIKNFRLAAEEQSLTHSALTKSIRKLEQDLGVRLFDRTTRIVEPTSAGTHLMEKVRVLLDQAESLVFEAQLVTGAKIGNLRVGGGPTATETLIPEALARFWSEHRNVDVDIRCADPSELVEQLLAGAIDLAVYNEQVLGSDKYRNELRIDPLFNGELVIVHRKGHPVVEAIKETGDYYQYPWAIPLFDNTTNLLPPDIAKQMAKRENGGTFRFQTLYACLSLAACSEVLTAAPLATARRFQEMGMLDYTSFPEPVGLSMSIFSVKRRSFSPVAEALVRDLYVAAEPYQQA